MFLRYQNFPYLCGSLKQKVMLVLELALILVVSYISFKPVRTVVRLFLTPLNK